MPRRGAAPGAPGEADGGAGEFDPDLFKDLGLTQALPRPCGEAGEIA